MRYLTLVFLLGIVRLYGQQDSAVAVQQDFPRRLTISLQAGGTFFDPPVQHLDIEAEVKCARQIALQFSGGLIYGQFSSTGWRAGLLVKRFFTGRSSYLGLQLDHSDFFFDRKQVWFNLPAASYVRDVSFRGRRNGAALMIGIEGMLLLSNNISIPLELRLGGGIQFADNTAYELTVTERSFLEGKNSPLKKWSRPGSAMLLYFPFSFGVYFGR